MLGVDPLTISSLMVLAASNPVCSIPSPAQINVIPKSSAVKYDYSKSLAALQAEQVDTINPYGFHGTSITNGFASSPISIEPKISMNYKYLPQYGGYCLWYEKIDIHINVDPTITIATELAKDSCKSKAVRDHELKHVRVSKMIVNKYAKTMGSKVFNALQQRGFVAGPIPQNSAQEMQTRMAETVQQIVEFEFRKMQLDHEEQQQAVDSLAEYERVNALCPNFDYSSALKSKGR